MPSLSELGQFKSSFVTIANEKADIESLSLPFDELKLPEKEAPPFNHVRESASSAGGSTPSSGLIFDEPDSSGGDFDFSAFVNDLPADITPPPIDDSPAGEAMSALDDFLKDLNSTDSEPAAEPEPEPEPDTDNFATPDDLLAGFSDEMETAPSDFNMDDYSTDHDLGAGDLGADVPGADDFNAGDFNVDDFGAQEDTSSADDMGIDLGGESPGGGFDSGDFGSADFGAADSGAADVGAEDFGSDMGADLGSIDLGGESAADSPLPDDFGQDDFSQGDFDQGDFGQVGSQSDTGKSDFGDGSIDLGGESQSFSPEEQSGDFSMDGVLPDDDFPAADFPSEDFSGDDFSGADSSDAPAGMADFGEDFASSSIELDTTPVEHSPDASGSDFSGGEVFGGDDFEIPGLEDIFEKTKIAPMIQPPPRKGLFGRKKAKAAEESDVEEDIEEISLSQDEVNSLLRTLSFYPLNLRITCEELIAEQVILPAQLSKLIRLLVNGAHVKETAAHVESITGKPVIIPKSFEKGSGAAFEAEQTSFGYIFVHNFLPVLRLFAVIAALLASVIYLGYNFVYIPIKAEGLYKRGYEHIPAGEFQRANELFQDAFKLHRKKKWFYLYAEAFRDQRRYTLAEGKYDELLRFYPRDRRGVLDYAALNTYYTFNYEKANRLLQRELLDFAPTDIEGLLAAGDNFMAWADSNPALHYDRYEDARFSYARVLQLEGWKPPYVERMLKYFIRTDDLRQVLELRNWFESSNRRPLSAESLAELGGYLLDKQLERPTGVPNAYVESIESVRDMLLQAVRMDPYLPESHYHLARYYHNLNNTHEERLTLENAIRAFDLARQESVRRRLYRVDAHYRYANLLINAREFFPAEEQVVLGIEHFEDFLTRNLIPASAQLGQLYSLRGDLEYFVKTGNMQAALANYHRAEGYGYAPPEVLYRMGAAYYYLENWRTSLEYLFKASADLPLNRRMLYALGNAAFQRGDYFAAHGYYNRLLDILESQRVRLPVLLPNDSIQFHETGERLMWARNNAGVVNEALAEQTGSREYRSRAMVMYAESSRAWDAITRNPETMTRSRLLDSPGAPSINYGYMNANYALRPGSGYTPQIFVHIDKDVLEPSRWEQLSGR